MYLTLLIVLGVGLAVYRALLLGIPFFVISFEQSPWSNAICGFASDLTLWTWMGLLFVSLAMATRRWQRTWPLQALAVSVFLLLAATLAAHMKYVEHFGMMARPFHVAVLGSSEVLKVGSGMVFMSWRSLVVLISMAAALPLFMRLGKRAEDQLVSMPWRAQAKAMMALALLGVAGQATMIQLRRSPNVHAELRYNVLAGLYYTYDEYKKVAAMPIPKTEELVHLRRLVSEPRTYAAAPLAQDFPLWQTRIAAQDEGGDSGLRNKLREFMADEAKLKGPWNVVLVLSESLRANELEAFGPVAENYRGLMANFGRIAATGVRFTGTLSAGYRTHIGQTAAFCSLYSANDFTLLNGAPAANAKCLGDVFNDKGYENFFFYGADNNFDNQAIFYQRHHMHHIVDERDFPKGSAKGGWGQSDHALFQLAADRLSAAKKPFFATILTLSNHAPLQLPTDAPSFIRKDINDVGQLLQYVDWSTGLFYERLEREFPHTIFVFIADHGRFLEDLVSDKLPVAEMIWKTARIPFMIAIPDMPESLRGHEIQRIASNVDVAPTLVSLLGWSDTAQQFMGEDAFTRRGPVMLDWQNTLIQVLGYERGTMKVEPVEPALERLYGAAERYNMIAPPLESTKDEKGAGLRL